MSYLTAYNAIRQGIPGRGVLCTAESGTIAAGLAAGGIIWTFRNPEASTKPILVGFVRPLTVVVTAFAVANTPGRGLDLVRLTPAAPGTADPSGGSATTAVRVRSNSTEGIGVGRIATTGALTTTGFNVSTQIRKHDFSFAGGSNNVVSNFWKFGFEEEPVYLLPGEAIGLAASQLMDATGTFRAIIDFSAAELPT